MKYNYALCLAYEGTGFLGWQKTAMGPSIEGSVHAPLEQIVQQPVVLQVASRTDRGVHAEEQWVNFYSDVPLLPTSLQQSLNALLPPTVRVLCVREMPAHFHPTLHVEAKEYHYHISLGPLQMPKERLFCWHVPYLLNLEHMHQAATYFLGTHDFSSFCNFRKNLNYKDKCRNIEAISLQQPEPHHLMISIKGNHFLYKMVRTMVGTLIYVGRGKIAPEAIPTILKAGSRIAAGVTAPAHGLTLKKIYYPQEFNLGL